jgi:hypothetical protein
MLKLKLLDRAKTHRLVERIQLVDIVKDKGKLRIVIVAVAAAFTVLSSVLPLLPDATLTSKLFFSVGIFITAGLCALGWSYLIAHGFAKESVSPQSVWQSKIVVEPEYDLVSQAYQRASTFFGHRVSLPPLEECQKWRQINKRLLACIVDRSRKLLGFFVILPLSDIAGRTLFEGELKENDLKIDNILTDEQAVKCNYVYIALAASCIENELFNDYLYQELFRYIVRYYPPIESRRYITFGYTPEGGDVLKLYGFVMERNAKQTANSRELYVRGGDITETFAYRYYYEQLSAAKPKSPVSSELSNDSDLKNAVRQEIKRRNRIENPWGTEWGNPTGTRKAILIGTKLFLVQSPAEAHLDIVHRMTPIESESLKPENYGFYNLEKQEFYTDQSMWDYLEGVAENLVGVVAHE